MFLLKKGIYIPLSYYSGGADQARTDDPLLAKQVLYQLSYNPRTLPLSFESQHILYIYLQKVKSKKTNSLIKCSTNHFFVLKLVADK